jgi:hypothetical protein
MKTVPQKLMFYFLAGMLLMLMLVMITGAYNPSPGRFQVTAYGASGIGFGAFVIDTQTGETRLVYLNTGMETEQRNHLGKSFEEIR